VERSPERRRKFLVLYQDPRYPIFVRNLIGVGPLWSLVICTLAPILVIPRQDAIWLTVPFFLTFELVSVLSYRVPGTGLPGWVREEIAAGRVQVAVPDRGDRTMLRMILLVATLAEIAAPLAAITGSSYQGP
jgi:hypothetical protein